MYIQIQKWNSQKIDVQMREKTQLKGRQVVAIGLNETPVATTRVLFNSQMVQLFHGTQVGFVDLLNLKLRETPPDFPWGTLLHSAYTSCFTQGFQAHTKRTPSRCVMGSVYLLQYVGETLEESQRETDARIE